MPGENEVVDETQKDVTGKEASADDVNQNGDTDRDEASETDTGKETPVTDGSGKDRDAAQFMDNLMSQYSIETPEQLAEFIGELAGVKDALGDEDIQDLIDNKKTMIRYQMQWAAEKERKQRESETPEETIKRLDGELQKEKDLQTQARKREEDRKENDRLIATFNTFVGKEVDALKIGDHLKGPLKKYLGVNNPIHDIDLSNKVGIKKLISEAGKAFESLEQEILKKAKVKIEEVPTMTDTDTAAASPNESENQPKNLAEARRTATALLKQRLSGIGK